MCTFGIACNFAFDFPDIVAESSRLIGMSGMVKLLGVLICSRSGSMYYDDIRPLPNTPATQTIRRYNDNRLGAVYSSLYGFWTSRQAALSAVGQNAAIARRDAYSVILFNHSPNTCISNDFVSSADVLLNTVAPWVADGGTNYTEALTSAQSLMVQHWSNERYVTPAGRQNRSRLTFLRAPVLIFLSDGECYVSDAAVRSICRAAIDLG